MDPTLKNACIAIVAIGIFGLIVKLLAKVPKAVPRAAQAGNSSSPRFDPEPRRIAILAAGRYHWRMKVVYIANDGSIDSAECAAPNTTGIPSHKITNMFLTVNDSEQVPLHRIRSIEVLAATQETRERYRVRETASHEQMRTWGEAIAAAIETKGLLEIAYQDHFGELTKRRIQPIKLMAPSRPKVRAHCYLANDEREFIIERILALKAVPPEPAADVLSGEAPIPATEIAAAAPQQTV